MRVDVENLYFSYPGKEVLNGVSLHGEDWGILCILGPNGCGKSTLVKCIEGLLPPAAGTIALGGRDAAGLSRSEIAKLIGYVPQSSSLLFSSTVFDTVMMGRKPYYSWRCSDEDIDIVVEILQLMELDDLAMDQYGALSGGQQQRVLIARALAQRPRLLLLDEPTSALDIAHQLEVMELLRGLSRERELGIIMVVHDLNTAARYADRVALLRDGRVFAAGRPEETLTASCIAEVYGVEADIRRSSEGGLSVTPVRRIKPSPAAAPPERVRA